MKPLVALLILAALIVGVIVPFFLLPMATSTRQQPYSPCPSCWTTWITISTTNWWLYYTFVAIGIVFAILAGFWAYRERDIVVPETERLLEEGIRRL